PHLADPPVRWSPSPDLLVANARIENRVANVDEDDRDHEESGEDEVEALDHRIVEIIDRPDEIRAHAGNDKNALEDDRAGDDVRQPDTDHRHNGDEGIPEGVPVEHRSLG